MKPTTGNRDALPHARFPNELDSIAAINALIDDDSVNDGYTHPAESMLDEHIEQFGAAGLIEHAFITASPIRAADLIRLLGRIPEIEVELRRMVVERGLASPHVVVRDAALQAAETWEDDSLVILLRDHRDVIPWLNEYVEKIVRGLRI
jgi:hypothetical protein